MTLNKLHNTTIVSTELTHSRIKKLATKIGVSEDIISRLALGISIREGPVSDEWVPTKFNDEIIPESINSGKSLKGKTLFKNELALWMVLLSNKEGKMDSIEAARRKFILHWERGVEIITKEDNGEDWINLIASLYSPQDSQ
ncbi:MAG: hypothetical protein CMA91_02040 [Euryarchaeota archaeon]|nr:hypothetical protein [Euryarchaeota archaeon]